MSLMETLRERAAARPMRVAFPEGDNETMMRAVAELTQRLDVPCYLSLDERMGCGLGACLVCAVKVRGEDGEHYSHVCKQGPVYRREEVVFE